ncbi:exodeoxyribonuclease III [Candidatus Albibeggiatoa sp. nov. NOAA]|uniref:exodeoxyribonuclease III n=1 Tax=Candidatus Albibeggiatoa sp. nov. NOAA TaxID=3162724 RepID=UPI0033018059|nr:exodeoxyribonuclease III [Thiotrichaceae bacterium]
MRIITANVNGIRAAARKGFFDWLAQQQADFVCIQETKAQIDQLSDAVFHPQGYHCFYHDAQKKGYSGVAIYSRQEPQQVKHGIGWEEIDCEGRYLEVQCENISVVSLYMHSGTSGTERQDLKYHFMDKFLPYLEARKQENLVICGDWNIAHKQIDLKNWRPNQKNSGFLPEERAWMDKLFDETGYVDAFRQVNQEPHQYTWWSNRGQAWANNTGWRIDYQVVTESLRNTVQNTSIYKEQRFSDHAPLIIDYDFSV